MDGRMLIGEFDELLEAKPFTPFEIITADGRALRVKSPEFAWHPPDSTRTVWVAKGSGGAALVDLDHITQVVVGGRSSANGKKKHRE
jgi:hypothetical protein